MKNMLRAGALALLLAGTPVFAAQTQGNEFRVAGPEVQQYLQAAFPQDYDALGGLFTLTASDPELTIPETGQRLQMSFLASAASAGGQSVPVARVDLSSALRYDPAGYALYLDQPSIDNVRTATPGQRVDQQTRMLINLWLSDYASDEPLYRLEPAMVAALGGLNVESTRIENGHVVVRFNQDIGALPASIE